MQRSLYIGQEKVRGVFRWKPCSLTHLGWVKLQRRPVAFSHKNIRLNVRPTPARQQIAANQPREVDLQPHFLLDLAHRSLQRGFSAVHHTARESPEVSPVALANEKNAPGFILEQGRGALPGVRRGHPASIPAPSLIRRTPHSAIWRKWQAAYTDNLSDG